MNRDATACRRGRARALVPLLLAALLPLGGCQALGAWAIGQSSPIEWDGHDRVELPLTLNNWGTPTVPVQVMGRDVAALVDTGSTQALISRSFAVAADVRIKRGQMKANGEKRSSAEDVQIRLGPVSTTAMRAVIDENEVLPFMLGMPLFLQAVVEMDFDTGRLTLIRPDAFEPPPAAPIKVKLVHALPTLPLYVNGRDNQICAIVDTGFNSGLSLMPAVLEKLALPAHPSGATVISQGAFGVKQEDTALAPVDDVRLGGLMYREVHVGHAPAWSKESCGNLLGMNILYRHRVIFDLRNRRFWLLPRAGNQW